MRLILCLLLTVVLLASTGCTADRAINPNPPTLFR